MTALRGDTVNTQLLGIHKIISDDSAIRALKRMDEANAIQWLQEHLQSSYAPLLTHPWILDVDVTVKPLYGHQEGAKIGYNPHKPGRPSHTYHTYMMANTRLVLEVNVQSGDKTHSSHSMPGLVELLRRLANFAAKNNLCSGLSFKIQMPKVENYKTEELTNAQLQKLMQVLEEESDIQVSNLVRLALYTGMRRGELFNLNWGDIDFYNKTITVKSDNKGDQPTIPLNEMAEKVLVEHAHTEKGSKFVFPGRGGKKRTECKRPLLRIREKAGLPDDFRILQGLRHVYASMLVSSISRGGSDTL